MKKILAMLLAVMMLLSVASVAMAENEYYTPETTVKIKKNYELSGEGTSPAETFYLKMKSKSVSQSEATDAPALPADTNGYVATVEYAKGAAGSATKTGEFAFKLPTYTKVGVYTYILEEVDNGIAGVTYNTNGNTLTLVVTVVNDATADGKLAVTATVHTESPLGTKAEDKKDSFDNTYTANKLTVTKNVTGKLGDLTKDFYFQATFTSEKEVTSEVKYGDQTLTFTKGNDGKYTATATFTLNGSTANQMVFANLPKGVTYTVVELSGVNGTEVAQGGTIEDKYTVSYDNAKSGTMEGTALSTTITNNYDGTIDMGVMLDSMPYVLVLAVVGAAVIALIAKKRRAED